MKTIQKTSLTLSLFFMLLINNVFSQKVLIKEQYSYGKIVKSDTFVVDKIWKLNSPGFELKLASSNFYTGLIMTNVGALTSLIGYRNQNSAVRSGSLIVGGCVSLTGVVFIINSHIHLKRAGFIMDDRGIGLSIPIKYKKN